MKRTPGNWRVERPYAGSGGLGYSVWAETADGTDGTWRQPVAHGLEKADAELMALAPELLEVVELMARAPERHDGDPCPWCMAKSLIAKARARR